MFKLVIIDELCFGNKIYSYLGSLCDIKKNFDEFIQEHDRIEWSEILSGEIGNTYRKFSLQEINPLELNSIYVYTLEWQNDEQNKADLQIKETDEAEWYGF